MTRPITACSSLFLLVTVLVVGCATRMAPKVEAENGSVDTARAIEATPAPRTTEGTTHVTPGGWDNPAIGASELEGDRSPTDHELLTVYFAFDSSDLDDSSRSQLAGNARWIRENPGVSIVVEGHCDERGTIEYNLALGERRADAVRSYLESLGVERSRVRIVSYGEERPASGDSGEWAHSRNRRAESVIERSTP